MSHATVDGPAIKAYWQPGCTSCLRMKEFLTKRLEKAKGEDKKGDEKKGDEKKDEKK